MSQNSADTKKKLGLLACIGRLVGLGWNGVCAAASVEGERCEDAH
jgi:hypothetical protein